MTLTNRLTLFALSALALVLASFSAATYALARTHLMRQLDDRAAATLDTLVAAAEVEPDGLEWEPKDRRIQLRGDGETPTWAVFGDAGARLDGTDDADHDLTAFASAEPRKGGVTWQGERWRVARRTLTHPILAAVQSEPTRKRYPRLVFVTAWPVAPVADLLRTLAGGLAGVSVALWLAAAAVGRWVCRRALAPVRRMTEAARAIPAAEVGERLPVPVPRDELRDLAQAFNALLVRRHEAFERQRRFTGEASHQLRTPLAALIGQLEVALRRERDPAEYRRVLSAAAAQAGRLREIVESLLFLARADSDARLPGVEPLDLAAWLPRHLAESWAAHPRHADLRVDVSGSPCRLALAHPLLLGQAVDNLIDNAFKYSPPGLPVRVGLLADPDGVAIVVDDDGPGIAAADRGRVFEPFFRSDAARRAGTPGVGLGLAITARIVTAFGGRVTHGDGTRGCQFQIHLQFAKT